MAIFSIELADITSYTGESSDDPIETDDIPEKGDETYKDHRSPP